MQGLRRGSTLLGYTDTGLEIRQRHATGFPEFEISAQAAWEECVELQQQAVDSFCAGALDSVPEDALRIAGYWGDIPVAAAVLVLEHDPHVGPCVSVQWNYCQEGYRNLGWGRVVLHALRRVMRDSGIPTGCYTQRKGLKTYTLKYITGGPLRG